MSVVKQLLEFIEFTCIGILLAIIFDFFRAYRKFKIPTSKGTIIQDILYFVIATVIVSLGVINILIIAIIFGVLLHISKFSKYTIKFFIIFFKASESIFEFLNITLAFYKQILMIILKIFKKIVKKCCKSFFYVVNFNKCKAKFLHGKKLYKREKLKEVNNYETKEV